MAAFRVEIVRERCKGCHLCIHACPHGVLAVEESVNERGYFSAYAPEPEACRGCRFCYLMCPDGAVRIYREKEEKGPSAA